MRPFALCLDDLGKVGEASSFHSGHGFCMVFLSTKGDDSENGSILRHFPHGPAAPVVLGAEVLAQVGREHRVALRSEVAPARAHLAPAVIQLGDHGRLCWPPSAWRPQAQPSVNTQHPFLLWGAGLRGGWGFACMWGRTQDHEDGSLAHVDTVFGAMATLTCGTQGPELAAPHAPMAGSHRPS